MAKVLKVKLSNGQEMPMIGLGTYARKAEPGQYRQAVEWAIDAGYRHIDTASSYKNEEEVGEGINNKIKEGVVTREQLYVTTKLWHDSHDRVLPSLKESLARLNLDYVDLYLMHGPFSVNEKNEDTAIDYVETWKIMEEAVRLGYTKGIGVSNFNEEQLERLLTNCQIKPVVNQVEINITLTQYELVDFCKQRSVVPVAYTPFGLLSDARPEFAHLNQVKTDPKLGQLAEKYGKTRAQIALRYLVQRGLPALSKSFTKSRIEENLNIFDFALTEEEMALVDSYDIGHRCVPLKAFKHVKNYPFLI